MPMTKLTPKNQPASDNTVKLQENVLDSSLIDTPEQITDKEGRHRYPLLVTRYKALLIDALLIFFVMIVVMVVLGDSEYRSPVMIALGVVFFLLYEPLLTTYSATIGQRMMNIRLRSYDDQEQRIQLWQAYVRVVVKAMLGWVSFLSILLNDERRAIHDMAGRSIMIENEKTVQR